MTSEQQLDEALKFLVDWKHGTFKYYLHNGKNIGENFPDLNITDERDKLEWHLKSVGIDEKFIMPIIYHLIDDGYVEPNWQPPLTRESGNPPDQIKITWKGIIFWKKGGYVKQEEEKNIDKAIKGLTHKSLKQSVFGTKDWWKLVLINAIFSVVIAIVIYLLTKESKEIQKEPPKIELQSEHSSKTNNVGLDIDNKKVLTDSTLAKPKDTAALKQSPFKKIDNSK
jgi:hypothetical protein